MTYEFEMKKYYNLVITIILLNIFWGCSESSYIGIINVRNSVEYLEASNNSYRVKLKFTRLTKHNDILCSVSLYKQGYESPIENFNSDLSIFKYPEKIVDTRGHKKEKSIVYKGLTPLLDKPLKHSDFNYRIEKQGKYELILKVYEVNGSALENEISFKFEQIVND